MTTRSSRFTVLSLVLSLVASILVVVAPTAGISVVAQEPAAVGPPECFPNPSTSIIVGCDHDPDGDLVADVIDVGTIGVGRSFVVNTAPPIPPCGVDMVQPCYNSVSPPFFIGCQELVNDDPSQVRRCTGGGNGFFSDGEAHELFEFTDATGGDCGRWMQVQYVDGVPETDWATVGPQAAQCTVSWKAPRPDSLAWPTWVTLRKDNTWCTTAYPECDRTGSEQYYWARVIGDLAPRAAFDVDVDADALRIELDNTSIPFAEGATSYEWNFGDGASSTSTSPSHTYDRTGEYTVSLVMSNGRGGTRSATQRIDLRPPELEVRLDGPGEALSIGEEFDLSIDVATVGSTTMRDVVPGSPVVELSDNVELVGEMPAFATRDLAPFERIDGSVRLRVVDPGPIEASTTWSGRLPSGRVDSWTGVYSNRVSIAKCSVTQSGRGGSELRFEDTSGEARRTWSFSDGTTSTERFATRVAQSPGVFSARITVDDDSGTCEADVDAPGLTMSLAMLDADTGERRSVFGVDEEFVVELSVGADTRGVGSLDVTIDADSLFASAEQLEVLSGPTPPLPVGDPGGGGPVLLRRPAQVDIGGGFGGVEIAPGTETTHRWIVRATEFGRFNLVASASADDAIGRPVEPLRRTAGGKIDGALDVELRVEPQPLDILRDNDGDGEITPADGDFEITAVITNPGSRDLTDVGWDDTRNLIIASNDPDEPGRPVELLEAPDEADLPDLAPGESYEATWKYRATGGADLRAELTVEAQVDGNRVTQLAETDSKLLRAVLLEGAITRVGPTRVAGSVVSFDGTFTNVSDRDGDEGSTVSFAVDRTLTGLDGVAGYNNGGNGWFGPPGGATPEGIEYVVLEPGDTVDLRAIVPTLQTDEVSGFQIDFEVHVVEMTETGEWEQRDALAAEISTENGSAEKHRVSLTPVVVEPESTNYVNCAIDLLITAEYWGCKLVRGVETALRGLWGVAVLAYDINLAARQGAIRVLTTYVEFLLEDEAGRQAIIAEIQRDLREMKERGHEALQSIDVEALVVAIPRMVAESLQELDRILSTGDLKLIIGELAEFAGENIDAVFEVLVAARTLVKVSKAAAGTPGPIRNRLAQAWELRRQKGLAQVDEVIATQGYRAVPEARVLPAGVDVTDLPKIWRDSYGLGEKDLQNLQKISAEYGVNIVFRSRSPKSIELIGSGRALPKPQGIKTKGVNDIDIEFLDYPSEYDSIVVHMEPPVKPTGNETADAAAAEKYATDVLAARRQDLVPGSVEHRDLRAQISARVETRMKEWTELTPEYVTALVEVDGSPIGIKVDFDPEFNGFPAEGLRYEPNRPIQLDQQASVNGRRVFVMKLQEPGGTAFKEVTGDIDFLAILKPDGGILGANGDAAELAKRGEVYEMMRSLVGMQHGESNSIVSDKVRAKYVKDGLDAPGGETLLAVTPQKRLVTTYFDDRLSTLKGGPNSELGDRLQGVAYFSGIFSELRTPNRLYSGLVLDELYRASRFYSRTLPVLFSISFVSRLLSLETPVEDTFDRDGRVVAPDLIGQLREFIISTGGFVPAPQPAGIVSPVRSTPAQAVTASPTASSMGGAITSAKHAVSSSVVSSGLLLAQTPGSDGGLAALRQIESELRSAGLVPEPPVGAEGGRWAVVDEAAVARGGTISIAPYSYVTEGIEAGATTVPIASLTQLGVPVTSEFFRVGDTVVIDPGGASEESVEIASLSPFSLTSPLANDHVSGSMIVLLSAAASAPSNTPGTDPDPGPGGDPSPNASTLVSGVTSRFVDTRRSGGKTVDGRDEGTGRLVGGVVVPVRVAGRGEVPDDAVAVVMNVTAVNPVSRGFIRVFPCGSVVPNTASLNFSRAGTVIGNEIVARVGDDGRVCMVSDVATDVTVDVVGHVPAGSSLVPLGPARVLETRSGSGAATVDGRFESIGRLSGGRPFEVEVAGRAGVDGDASAVIVNVTAVNPDGRGFVRVYPCGSAPNAASLNFSAAGMVAGNEVVAKVSAAGTVCVLSDVSTDLTMDVVGFVGEGAGFVPVAPQRFADTRPGDVRQTVDGRFDGAGALAGGGRLSLEVAGRGDVPVGVSAVVMNVTAVNPVSRGFTTVFPCGVVPDASSVNYGRAGTVVGNEIVARVDDRGRVCLTSDVATHLTVDVVGYVTE